MRYIFLYIAVAFGLYTESSYALEREEDAPDQHYQRGFSVSKSQDLKEIMRGFKASLSPQELQRLQASARQFLADEKNQQEARIVAATGIGIDKIVAH